MKPELLVIAGQLYCGEYVLESCTRVAMRSDELVGDPPSLKLRRVGKSDHDNTWCHEAKSQPVSVRGRVKGESSST